MSDEALASALQELRSGKPAVAATVVKTSGSTPQKAGARIVVRNDGSVAGTIGGGCVEGDVWFQAREMLTGSRQQLKLFNYTLNESVAANDGLVCGGTMQFMLERLDAAPGSGELLSRVLEARSGAAPPLATLTVAAAPAGSEGGIRPGPQAARDAEQPAAAAPLLQRARQLEQDMPRAQEVLWVEDDPRGYTYCIERHAPPIEVIIAGAGHVGKAIADLAHLLKLRVAVVDDRPEFASRERFPHAHKLEQDNFQDALPRLAAGPRSHIVIVTRGHKQDLPALQAAVATPAPYIGIMGSRRKGVLLIQELVRQGLPAQQAQRIRTPIGLDIGAITPAEIAVSILSEIMALNANTAGGSLRMDAQLMHKAVGNN